MSDATSEFRGQARRALVLIYASIQFLVLTAVAMLVYPGGAVYELDANRYLFLRNFFSDLGATVTPSGRPNLISHILLVIALGCVGLALILASSNWKVIVATTPVRTGRGARLAGARDHRRTRLYRHRGNAVEPGARCPQRLRPGSIRLSAGLRPLSSGHPAPQSLAGRLHGSKRRLPPASLCLRGNPLFRAADWTPKAVWSSRSAAQKIIVYASVINLGLQAVSIRREVKLSSAELRGRAVA